MPSRTLLIDVVGLTVGAIGAETPNLAALARTGVVRPLECPFPALTCSSQATLLTGRLPRDHGIVGNGWFFRELDEIWLWRQAHGLMQAEDLHGRVRREIAGSTVARLFLWYAFSAPADFVATPRPQYRADGRKLPDLWTSPPKLRDRWQRALGPFPLFQFWGPGAGLASSAWIIAAARDLLQQHEPTLLSVYVPHLDYDFQRHGPDAPASRAALRDVDRLLGPLLADAAARDMNVIVFSEYGINAVSRPVHINRALRTAGLLAVREEAGLEHLDPVASRAFAVADHQIAHVYVRHARDRDAVHAVLTKLDGVDIVLNDEGKRREGLDHPRSGEFVAVAAPDAWFTYYYWLDDARAPDFARCVDIHRKPGYDPAELMFDPGLRFPKLAAARRLAQRALGFRALFDVIGLDPSVVKGSHGRRAPGPVLLMNRVPDGALQGADHGDAAFPTAAFPDLIMGSLR